MQPPLGLAIVAALTPDHWSIRMVDENFKPFRYREADLVGITAFTSNAYRAYEIAKEYREKGIPVVLGGIHATLAPEEAAGYVDTVVTGEAEMVWKDVLADFEAGQLKRQYRGNLTDLSLSPIPRYDLFHPAYIFGVVQTTRGCPMDCEFCSVPVMNSHQYRLRPIKDILDELEGIPNKYIYFVDDNMLGYNTAAREHAMELFRGMVERNLKKEWFAYASINVADNEEVVRLAAASGCKMLLVGIESESDAQLSESNKKLNLKGGLAQHRKLTRLLHKYGICALGTFIFGFDADTPEALEKRARYMKRSSFDVTQATILTPFPGTRLYDRLLKEGKIIGKDYPYDWQFYQGIDIVHHPGMMEPEELRDKCNEIIHRLYPKSLLRFKMLRTLWNTRSIRAALWAYQTNLNYHVISREELVRCIDDHDRVS